MKIIHIFALFSSIPLYLALSLFQSPGCSFFAAPIDKVYELKKFIRIGVLYYTFPQLLWGHNFWNETICEVFGAMRERHPFSVLGGVLSDNLLGQLFFLLDEAMRFEESAGSTLGRA